MVSLIRCRIVGKNAYHAGARQCAGRGLRMPRGCARRLVWRARWRHFTRRRSASGVVGSAIWRMSERGRWADVWLACVHRLPGPAGGGLQVGAVGLAQVVGAVVLSVCVGLVVGVV